MFHVKHHKQTADVPVGSGGFVVEWEQRIESVGAATMKGVECFT